MKTNITISQTAGGWVVHYTDSLGNRQHKSFDLFEQARRFIEKDLT